MKTKLVRGKNLNIQTAMFEWILENIYERVYYITKENKKVVQRSNKFWIRWFCATTSNNIARSHWSLGWINSAFPSNETIVQLFEVKLPNSFMIRPTAFLCLLENLHWIPVIWGMRVPWWQVTLIFHRRIRFELIAFLLRFDVFYYSQFSCYTWQGERFSSIKKTWQKDKKIKRMR